MNYRNVAIVIDEKSCTGCGACRFICPRDAVELKENEKNILVRSVDDSKCISCGKCVNVCPGFSDCVADLTEACFAAYPSPEMRNENYSSGGAASLIAESFIKKYGGVVFGCEWDKSKKIASHIAIEDPNQLYRICGSKYVQSDIRDAFVSVKHFTDSGKNVLFIGTPCQIDAVKRVFGSENIYTIDLVCHGTPPAAYLKEHLSSVIKNKADYDLRFRGKDDFWITATDDSGNYLYKKFKEYDIYFQAFLNGIIYRDNCYTCKYANLRRVADITLGDFWGLDRNCIDYSGRISLVLQNNEKGKKLLESTDGLIKLQRNIEEAVKENKQLSSPMEITEDRSVFVCNFKKTNSFISGIKKTELYKITVKKNRRRKITAVKSAIKGFAKRIVG